MFVIEKLEDRSVMKKTKIIDHSNFRETIADGILMADGIFCIPREIEL